MAVSGIDLGKYKLGWHDSTSDYVYVPKKGLNETVVRDISSHEGRARVDDQVPAQRAEALRAQADARVVREEHARHRLRRHLLLPQADRRGRSPTGTMLPESMQTTYEKLGIPEAERKFLAGATAQYECLRGSTLVWTTEGMRRSRSSSRATRSSRLTRRRAQIVRSSSRRCTRAPATRKSSRSRPAVASIGASANHPFLVLRDERKPGRQRRRFAAQLGTGRGSASRRLRRYRNRRSRVRRRRRRCLLPRARGWRDVCPLETSDDLCWWAWRLPRRRLPQAQRRVRHRRDRRRPRPIRSSSTRSSAVGRELFGLELPPRARRASTHAVRAPRRLAEFVELNGLGGNAHTKRIPDWVFGRSRVHSGSRSWRATSTPTATSATTGTNHDVSITSANEALLLDAKQLAALCGITVELGEPVHWSATRSTRIASMTGYRLQLSGRFDRLPVPLPAAT